MVRTEGNPRTFSAHARVTPDDLYPLVDRLGTWSENMDAGVAAIKQE